jgi:DNA-binding transcriptional LysR family regulator
MRSLQDIDLNLLRLLHVLGRETSASGAARVLGLSQPAVSNALRRARSTLGDPLFTRTARGLLPTAYMLGLQEPLAQALATLEAAIQPATQFAAARTQRRFTLAMSDIGEIVFLPPLQQHLSLQAPGVRLSTVRQQGTSLREELESGAVDAAIGLITELGDHVFSRRLFQQRYRCMARPGHPLLQGPVNKERFAQARHVVVQAAGTGHDRVNQLYAQAGLRRDVVLEVPHFVAVPYIVAASDLIATVPEALALATAPALGLQVFAPPLKLPPISIALYWHRRQQADAANRWLRELLLRLFAGDSALSSPI